MYKQNTLPKSIDRWRIVAEIQTKSPLHVGDGDRVKISTRDCVRESLDDADPDYATVFTGQNGRPYLPATSIKGALRAWASAHRLDKALIQEVFGHADRGGAVTFHDAPLLPKSVTPPRDPKCRFWCGTRSTALSPQVVIDPVTRSAQESLLYYVEYVPEGATFEITVTAQNATSQQRGLLLYVLRNAFGSEGRPARLGSGVANGWGQMSVTRWDAKTLDAAAWIASELQDWRLALQPISAAEKLEWSSWTPEFERSFAADCVRLRLTLHFSGAMLVNDPTRRTKGDSDGAGAVGHCMIRKENGDFYLPAESVRGAFRAQARRIWQTLAWDKPHQNASSGVQNAPRNGDEERLAAFFKLFGATGWRAPIEVEDFRLAEPAEERPQEFVAIDRFTGGAAGKKKFNAVALWKPKFVGDFTVRTDRLVASGAGCWIWLLLAFTLRDWMEGDGSIGFGRSKNYGGMEASVDVSGTTPEATALRGILGNDATVLNGAELVNWAQSLESAIGEVA